MQKYSGSKALGIVDAYWENKTKKPSSDFHAELPPAEKVKALVFEANAASASVLNGHQNFLSMNDEKHGKNDFSLEGCRRQEFLSQNSG